MRGVRLRCNDATNQSRQRNNQLSACTLQYSSNRWRARRIAKSKLSGCKIKRRAGSDPSIVIGAVQQSLLLPRRLWMMKVISNKPTYKELSPLAFPLLRLMLGALLVPIGGGGARSESSMPVPFNPHSQSCSAVRRQSALAWLEQLLILQRPTSSTSSPFLVRRCRERHYLRGDDVYVTNYQNCATPRAPF